MKKILYIIFAALLGAVSCSVNGPDVSQPQEEGKVTFTMKVTFPEVLIDTKASTMANTPNVDNIYVAVFGGNHYLNEYVKAVPCDDQGNKIDEYGSLDNDKDFWFKVTLSATTSKRFVHVFANGPSSLEFNKYEDEIMKTLTTEDPIGSYWSYIVLPNGTALIDPDGTPHTNPAAEALFQDLRLIRNFARVRLDVAEGVNFDLTGFQIYNTPSHGSVAVWNDSMIDTEDDRPEATGFFKDYYTKDFAWLIDKNGDVPNYTPCVPVDELKPDTPSADDVFDDQDKFVYERPDAASNRPYIIMKGTFGDDGTETFYRLELVDPDGNYLPLFRNQDYYIHLNAVSKRGVTNPSQAVTSNANVSAVASMDLPDLSNGISRIIVEWSDQAYMTAGEKTFKYKYLPIATNNTPEIATLEIREGAGSAISGTTVDTAFSQSGPDSNGWYTVTFSTTAPGDNDKLTKFRVIGTHDDQKLYRDINVRVLKYLEWGNPTVVSSGSALGSTVDVTFTLRTGLPASIFPIEIALEDRYHYLDPLSDDMPAIIGESIVANKTDNSYQFVKTLNYLDYVESGGNVVTCKFRRVRTGTSATTLYFKNKYYQSVGSVAIPN